MDTLDNAVALEPYKTFFQRLRSETLRRVLNDRSTALETARRGIKTVEPDKLTDRYIQSIADEMQKVAKIILEKRARKQ